MTLLEKVKKHGLSGSLKIAARRLTSPALRRYHLWRVSGASEYAGPDSNELISIENNCSELGISIDSYQPAVGSFRSFQAAAYFPTDYHGGISGPVWDEKLVEHWIAWERLGLGNYRENDIYIDIAAGGSPWADVLRKRTDVSSYAIDLHISDSFKTLPFYKVENAISTSFDNESISGASLQCAYEMFMYQDDINLWKEMQRILKPGGKVVVVPLYLHTHYSSYSTPEYFAKGYSDCAAKEYVCTDWNGIPSARFYDVKQLKARVLDTITAMGMKYKLLALRNKTELGNNIYCHFILEVTK